MPTLVGLAGLLMLMTLVSYRPVLEADFIWDDDEYVTENSTLLDADGLRRIWFEPGATPQYYPIVHTSFWFEYAAWELAPFGYHLDNVLLHVLCALLVWQILRELGVPGSWLAAALFALHPVQVESVAWITERKNVLSGAFYLASLLCFVRIESEAFENAFQKIDWHRPLLAFSFFLLALLSKTVTASLPAVVLLVHWWRRGRIEWSFARILLPGFVLGCGFGLFTAWMEQVHVGASGAEWTLGFVERCLVAGRALFFYIGKLLWPRELVFVYPRWQIDVGAFTPYLYPVGVVLLTLMLWVARKRLGRGPIVCWLFFAGTLFPALGFLNVFPHRFSYVADHFQYLASLGVLVPVAAILAKGLDRLSPFVNLALRGGLLAILAILTWQQSGHYLDMETLWRHTLVHNPDSYLAHSHLGNLDLAAGREREALAHYREALRVKPDDVLSLNNLAWFLATSKFERDRDPQLAVRYAERAAEQTEFLSPGILDTLAVSYAAAGRFPRAVAVAEQGIGIAEAVGDDVLASEMRQRLRLYRAGRSVGRAPSPVAKPERR